MGVQVVWFKRDLRVDEHVVLREAASHGPVLCLFVVEPGYWALPEHDAAHLVFLTQCLAALDDALRARGNRLVVRTGRVRDVLASVHRTFGIDHLRSHEEVGNAWTYARDRAVQRWVDAHDIPWTERAQTGVIRPHPRREGWGARWHAWVSQPPGRAPDLVPAPCWPEDFDFGTLPAPETLGLGPTRRPLAQPGGSPAAHELLHTFLAERGLDYRAAMASPLAGWEGCSRLSPHLAWGTLGPRTVWHAARARHEGLTEQMSRGESVDPRWLASLESFGKRLAWRDHFLQRLEDQPDLEHRNLARSVDDLRVEDTSAWDDWHHRRFEAWREGRTGYPMVDAVMRCLHATGWVNFRMRAMVVSFASYDLWLHWRPTGLELARRFVDFEPGIHFNQMQMQSGATGINALRIYDPTRQQVEHDPRGDFVRDWVPELARVPLHHLAEPHRMSLADQRAAGCHLGVDYPAPIVRHADATRMARARLEAARRTAGARAQAQDVFERHGSRRGPGHRR